MPDTCVSCGEPVPDMRIVCQTCERRYDPDEFFSAERRPEVRRVPRNFDGAWWDELLEESGFEL